MTDHIQKTKDMIDVMQAYVDGAEIEMLTILPCGGVWQSIAEPSWNWLSNEYRVAITKDSIDWSHVSPAFKYMARDEDGYTYLYAFNPTILPTMWTEGGTCTNAKSFISYRRGNCDWEDSLVRRPE